MSRPIRKCVAKSTPRKLVRVESFICGVCLKAKDEIWHRGRLPLCDHFFCFECILEWSKVTQSCPECKTPFRLITKESLLDDEFVTPIKYFVAKRKLPTEDDDDNDDNDEFDDDGGDFFASPSDPAGGGGDDDQYNDSDDDLIPASEILALTPNTDNSELDSTFDDSPIAREAWRPTLDFERHAAKRQRGPLGKVLSVGLNSSGLSGGHKGGTGPACRRPLDSPSKPRWDAIVGERWVSGALQYLLQQGADTPVWLDAFFVSTRHPALLAQYRKANLARRGETGWIALPAKKTLRSQSTPPRIDASYFPPLPTFRSRSSSALSTVCFTAAAAPPPPPPQQQHQVQPPKLTALQDASGGDGDVILPPRRFRLRRLFSEQSDDD